MLNLKRGETLLIRPSKMQVFLDKDRKSRLDEDDGPLPDPAAEVIPAFGTILW